MEYLIVMTSKSITETETRLNELAELGWRVVAATDNLVYLERSKTNILTEG